MKLRFYARGTALVSDFDALDRPLPLRRFIGRRYTEITPGRWGFAPTGEADEVGARPEIVKAALDGELWPADEATAKACGVKFDPKFGGEITPSKSPTDGKEKA